ncbi:thiamine pyrophosphate-binding protein [Chloroflexota bacterium]
MEEEKTTAKTNQTLNKAEYGSDVIVDVLKELDIEYISMNPGATLQGIHDSLVNYGGNKKPEIVLCCHEEIAVDLAHGYNMVSSKPMAAMVHNIIGLLHATMAIFNAWVGRIPVLVIGGTGPVNTEERRPWIDWIHTAVDQGNVVRDYVKWDNLAASLPAAVNAILRGYKISNAEPRGPVYVCLDSAIQEKKLAKSEPMPDASRYVPPASPQADPTALSKAAEMLFNAEHPVVIADFLGMKTGAMESLVELAETLSLPVLDKDGMLSIPTTHPLDLTGAENDLFAEADVILSLDVFDLYQALNMRETAVPLKNPPVNAKIIDISLRHYSVKGWVQDFGELQPVDLDISADTALAIPALTSIVKEMLAQQPGKRQQLQERFARLKAKHEAVRGAWQIEADKTSDETHISRTGLAVDLWAAIKNEDWVLINNARFNQPRQLWDITKPYQYIKRGQGGGIGFGIGRALGVALAHRPHKRLCVDIQPDGDLLYTSSGLWTAAHQRIPLLILMFNNRSYFNTENRQFIIAKHRGREVSNKIVGNRIENPAVDFATVARGFGVYGQGPIEKREDLAPALIRAIAYIKEKRLPALVDVIIP